MKKRIMIIQFLVLSLISNLTAYAMERPERELGTMKLEETESESQGTYSEFTEPEVTTTEFESTDTEETTQYSEITESEATTTITEITEPEATTTITDTTEPEATTELPTSSTTTTYSYSDMNLQNMYVKPVKSILARKKKGKIQVKIKWKAVPGVNGYIIKRKSSRQGKYKIIGCTKDTTYIDKTVKKDHAYKYFVTSFKELNGKRYYGQRSKAVSYTFVTPPGQVKKFHLDGGFIRKRTNLSWKKIKGASGYEVYLKKDNKKSYRIIKKKKKCYWTTKKYFSPGGKYKVRAYRKSNGKIAYGPFSKAETLNSKMREKVVLPVSCILQYPEYPSGCEVVSLAIALNYTGHHVSKQTLVNRYLPMQYSFYGPNSFDTAFLGNISSYSSWGGCYPGAICTAGNRYLSSVGDNKRVVKDISGTSFEGLYRYINEGIPVMIWATMHMGNSHLFCAGRTYGGRTLYWQSASHCLVIRGYDRKNNLIYVSDPMVGNVVYSTAAVRGRYIQTGQRAAVILEK